VTRFASHTGDNYGTWIHVITMNLRAKKKMGFVDDTLMKPISPNNLPQWDEANFT
jgi:hypothetical protein